MFCCTLLDVHSSIAIILMGKRELVALLYLSSWCLVKVERLFLAVPWRCLRFVIVVFPDHTHLLLLNGGVFGQNTMNTFSEARFYLNINIMVIFDHHSNLIAAALELETLLSCKNSWHQKQ